MGGSFSGYRGSKKRVVESCNTIDTTDLKRWCWLIPGTNRSGSLEWRRGNEQKPSSSVNYTLAVEGGTGTFRLQYPVGQLAERLAIPFGW
jgi:hypothetical protein